MIKITHKIENGAFGVVATTIIDIPNKRLANSIRLDPGTIKKTDGWQIGIRDSYALMADTVINKIKRTK